MAEQLPDCLLGLTSFSINDSQNLMIKSFKQTEESMLPQFNGQEVTTFPSQLSNSRPEDATNDLLVPHSNHCRTSQFQEISKDLPITNRSKSNSTAYSSPLVNKTGLKLNFNKVKVDKGQFANSSHPRPSDKPSSMIQGASKVTNETRRTSALHVNSTNRTEKKYSMHPTGLKTRHKYLSELSPKDCNAKDESLLASKPIPTKYEEIIRKFTGKLKISNEGNSEVSVSEDDIELCGEIGEGVSGTVHIVKHKASNIQMAAKKMKWKPHLEEQKRILMDLEIMAIQNSNYIVVYYGSLVSKDNVWLYMELMDTCFDKIIHKYGPLPEDILGKVVVATLNALHYLKSVHDIIHRDVKPSNILINKKGEIKMCDFGISKQLVESCAKTRGAGPTAYISPERLDIELKEYDVRADVWSLGITVIELLTGKLPYSHCQSDIEVMSIIFQDPPPRLPELISVSQDCRNFVELCLTKDYLKRPKFQELLECSQFVGIYLTKEVQVATWFSSLI